MGTPIRIVIADDHVLFRQALMSLLLLQPDLAVIGEAPTADELRSVLTANPCEILLLDLQMDRWTMNDIPDLARMTRVIVLTASESAQNGVRALRLGARAIVQKRFAVETLMTAIRTVVGGMVCMPPEVQTHFAQEGAVASQLTVREAEIVCSVASGMRNAEVARRLSITESTVKTHLNNIFQKLGLRDRLELTHYAIRTGLAQIIDADR